MTSSMEVIVRHIDDVNVGDSSFLAMGISWISEHPQAVDDISIPTTLSCPVPPTRRIECRSPVLYTARGDYLG